MYHTQSPAAADFTSLPDLPRALGTKTHQRSMCCLCTKKALYVSLYSLDSIPTGVAQLPPSRSGHELGFSCRAELGCSSREMRARHSGSVPLLPSALYSPRSKWGPEWKQGMGNSYCHRSESLLLSPARQESRSLAMYLPLPSPTSPFRAIMMPENTAQIYKVQSDPFWLWRMLLYQSVLAGAGSVTSMTQTFKGEIPPSL